MSVLTLRCCSPSSSELLLSLNHSLDTVVHVLDEVNLRAAESSQVGNIVNVIISLGVLTVSTTNLNVVLGSDSLELFLFVSELGELDVDRGTETGTEVGGARGDVAEVVIVSKLGLLLNASNTS